MEDENIEMKDRERYEEEQRRVNEEEKLVFSTTGDPVMKAFSLSTVRIRFLQGWMPIDHRHPKSLM